MVDTCILLAIFAVIFIFSYYLYTTFSLTRSVELKRLQNRRVVITGASRGIGEQLAYEYARYNCRIVLAARSIELLNQVAEKCRRLGATQVECIKLDASKEESCIRLIEETNRIYEGIDILVLNHTASIYEPYFNSDFKTNVDNMKHLFAFHTVLLYFEAMAALPHLAKSGTVELPSHIIAVSSLAGTCALPKTTIYGTTKHAIQGFFLNLARELQISPEYRKRVTTTVATLGLIATDVALEKTEKGIHFLAADVKKTAQTMIAAGVNGQTRIFYPRLFVLLPLVNHVFFRLFELATRFSS